MLAQLVSNAGVVNNKRKNQLRKPLPLGCTVAENRERFTLVRETRNGGIGAVFRSVRQIFRLKSVRSSRTFSCRRVCSRNRAGRYLTYWKQHEFQCFNCMTVRRVCPFRMHFTRRQTTCSDRFQWIRVAATRRQRQLTC